MPPPRQSRWLQIAAVWLVVLGALAALFQWYLRPRLAESAEAAAAEQTRAAEVATYRQAAGEAERAGWDTGDPPDNADAAALADAVALIRGVLDGDPGPDIWNHLDTRGRSVDVRPARVVFPRGTATVTPRMREALDGLGQLLRTRPLLFVDLVADVSDAGDAQANAALAQRRLDAVAGVLRGGLRSPLRVRTRTRDGGLPAVTLEGRAPGPLFPR